MADYDADARYRHLQLVRLLAKSSDVPPRLDDPALRHLALIVRGADTDALDLTPESRGLRAIAQGFSRAYARDQEQLEAELPVYDALYAWCQSQVELART